MQTEHVISFLNHTDRKGDREEQSPNVRSLKTLAAFECGIRSGVRQFERQFGHDIGPNRHHRYVLGVIGGVDFVHGICLGVVNVEVRLSQHTTNTRLRAFVLFLALAMSRAITFSD